MSKQIEFIGSFKKYINIEDVAYYFVRNASTHVQYLISCKEHPEYIGELKPEDKLEIKANFDRQIFQGGVLKNVEWRLL